MLDSFIVDANNKLAYDLALSATLLEKSRNPIIICGKTGLGKTHLLLGIREYIQKTRPDKVVIYVKAADFVNELIGAIRHNSTIDFRRKYHNTDALLIDNFDYLEHKLGTQEELRSILEQYEGNSNKACQIFIATSKKLNKEAFDSKLYSIIQSGLKAEITPLTYEGRLKIANDYAKNKCKSHIRDEVIEYIAQEFESNIREMEGALNQIDAYSEIYDRKIGLEDAEILIWDWKRDWKSLS